MQNIRILIIEENQAVVTALQRRLQLDDHVEIVGRVPDREHLPEILQRKQPHVLLLGLTSSSRANRRITEETVSQAAKAGTAVIILSPYIDDTERQMAKRAGASRYFLKTINTKQLIQAIKTVATNKK